MQIHGTDHHATETLWEKKEWWVSRISLTGALLIFYVFLYLLFFIPLWLVSPPAQAQERPETLLCVLLTLLIKWGVCCRWSWSVLPQVQSWVCAHPELTDGSGANTVDPRWPQARGVHSQRQTISIISASPGYIMETALQHCVVHRVHVTRWSYPPWQGRTHTCQNVSTCVHMFWWTFAFFDSRVRLVCGSETIGQLRNNEALSCTGALMSDCSLVLKEF